MNDLLTATIDLRNEAFDGAGCLMQKSRPSSTGGARDNSCDIAAAAAEDADILFVCGVCSRFEFDLGIFS